MDLSFQTRIFNDWKSHRAVRVKLGDLLFHFCNQLSALVKAITASSIKQKTAIFNIKFLFYFYIKFSILFVIATII